MATDDLLAQIEAFLRIKGVGMTETTFGRLAVNDGKFVGRLRAGGTITLVTQEKVQKFIAERQRVARKAAA